MFGAIEAQIMFTLQSKYLIFFNSLGDSFAFCLSIATVFCWKWQNIRDRKALGIWMILWFKMEKTSADWFERINWFEECTVPVLTDLRNASVPVSAAEPYFNYLRYILPFKRFWFKFAYLHRFQQKTRPVLLLISLIRQGCLSSTSVDRKPVLMTDCF